MDGEDNNNQDPGQ